MATMEELNTAINEATGTIQRADNLIRMAVRRASFRIRELNLDDHTLRALKRELRDWDMHQKRWKR